MFKTLRGLFRPQSASEGPRETALEEATGLPTVSDRDTYRDVLRARFSAEDEAALARLHRAVDALPSKTERLLIGVHLSQDEEGGFHIRMHAAGPDQYVLNRAIAEWAVLFEGRTFAFVGTPANMPMFDPFDLPFPVAETLVEESIAWLERLWARAAFTGLPCPVEVFAEDGWTEILAGPVLLAAGPEG